jgi:hypothetical protein
LDDLESTVCIPGLLVHVSVACCSAEFTMYSDIHTVSRGMPRSNKALPKTEETHGHCMQSNMLYIGVDV